MSGQGRRVWKPWRRLHACSAAWGIRRGWRPERGAPRSFAATLQYFAEPRAAVEQRVVSVNSPLRVDGAKVFLVGHGYAPHLRLTDSTGRVVFDDTVVFLPQDGSFASTGVVKAPDGQPQLGLQALFAPTAALDQVRGPHSTFPAPDDPAMFFSAWSGDLGLDAGTPRNVFSLDTGGLEQLGLAALRPGESWEIPGGQGTVEFVALDRFATLLWFVKPQRRRLRGGGRGRGRRSGRGSV